MHAKCFNGLHISAHLTLCCHICCYQGNPAARQRSAERYTAWRRETCGAQPVAGKKPVRDSPTNPLHFLYPSPVITRWIEGRSRGRARSFAWLLPARSRSSLISKYKDNSNLVSLTKKKKGTYAGPATFSKNETFLL